MDPPLVCHQLSKVSGGPTLLMLHANSLHSFVFEPMLGVLLQHFGTIFAIDAPGQGSSPPWVIHSKEEGTAEGIAEVMYRSVLAFGLQGCFVFGHSMGGSLAALIESAHPGTFSAIYAFEPPLYTPSGAQAEASRGASRAGQVLGMLARKRRSRFPSQHDALQGFASKQPFATWHPQALEAYVRHGTRPLASSGAAQRAGLYGLGDANSTWWQADQAGAPALASEHAPSLPAEDQQQGQHTLQPQQQQQQQGLASLYSSEVELCCSPATEGAVYAAFEPPPLIPNHALPCCPFAWAVGDATQGVHSRLPVLGKEGVTDFPHGSLRRFLELSHFGPQEDPEGVARDVIAFFQCSRGPTLKQQDVVSCQVHMESVGKAGASLYQHKQPNFMSKM